MNEDTAVYDTVFLDIMSTPGSGFSVDGHDVPVRTSSLDQFVQIIQPKGFVTASCSSLTTVRTQAGRALTICTIQRFYCTFDQVYPVIFKITLLYADRDSSQNDAQYRFRASLGPCL